MTNNLTVSAILVRVNYEGKSLWEYLEHATGERLIRFLELGTIERDTFFLLGDEKLLPEINDPLRP